MKNNVWKIMAAIAILVMASMPALGAPQSPETATVVSSSGRTDGTTGTAMQALAGNVTLLFINDTRTTTRWQGYYGNVTGQVSLEDGSSHKLYDWQLASPQGEIYASNTTTVAWSNIMCFNFTKGATAQNVTLSNLENTYGMGANDLDGVNETFDALYTAGSVVVGSTTIVAGSCPVAYTNVNNASQSSDYAEILLMDNSSNNIVYATLLEQDATGFTGGTFDFQMLVGENGDIAGVSTYYFFVELN